MNRSPSWDGGCARIPCVYTGGVFLFQKSLVYRIVEKKRSKSLAEKGLQGVVFELGVICAF